MDARQRRRLLRHGARAARRVARALAAAGQRLAERLAYRPREVVVVALLGAGLFGGLAVERWRARHPETAQRLEVEPARTASPPVPLGPRPRSRSIVAGCERPSFSGSRIDGSRADPTPPRLDLNRATPGELARVAGISWRLAARIVAARDAFEGRGPQSGAFDQDQAGSRQIDSAAPAPRAPDLPEPAPDSLSP